MASSSSLSWHQVWAEAQPRLGLIQESLNTGTTPSERIVRVGQLDAELLDQELVQLLQEPVGKALNLINVRPSEWSYLEACLQHDRLHSKLDTMQNSRFSFNLFCTSSPSGTTAQVMEQDYKASDTYLLAQDGVLASLYAPS